MHLLPPDIQDQWFGHDTIWPNSLMNVPVRPLCGAPAYIRNSHEVWDPTSVWWQSKDMDDQVCVRCVLAYVDKVLLAGG